jgi:hypothetical protein
VTPLAMALVESATQALAAGGQKSTTERALRKYREDAQAVVVAVLARLGGKKGEPGLFAFASTPAQMILSIADEVEEGIEARVA